ncbi:hypothetical protein BVX98_02450, partial [bacterium F11]
RNIDPPINIPPTAIIEATPTSGNEPLTVTFVGSSSFDSDGRIDSYAWDFGDGDSAFTKNTSHTFDQAGSYTVLLTVTDNDLATSSTTLVISVINPETGNIPPTAVINTLTPVVGPAPLTVQFSMTDSFDPDNDSGPDRGIVNKIWNFQDGGTSNDREPSYEFSHPGTYDVVLMVFDDHGDPGTSIVRIVVEEGAGFIDPIEEKFINEFRLKKRDWVEIPCDSAVLIFTRGGQRVRTLHCLGNSVQWDGRNEEGSFVASGLHLIQRPGKKTKKLMFVK